MKSKVRALVIGIVLFVSIGFSTQGVQAATASASASPSSVEVGDEVTVSVSFKDNNIGAVYGTFSFDSSSLQYISGNNSSNGLIAGVAGSAGQSSIVVTMKFKALKSNTHKISISASEILDFDMNNLGTVSTSVNVVVTNPPEPEPEPTKPTTPSKTTTPTKPSTPATPVEPEPDPMEQAIEVTLLGEKAYLWPELTDVDLPEGFEEGDATYEEATIQVATRMQVSLAYITDEEGENGAFWNYNEKTQEFYTFVEFAPEGSYVFLQIDEAQIVPEGYSPTSVEIGGEMLQGWIADDNQLEDFILLYATNDKGEEGFYLYDLEEGTMQRFGQRIVEVEVEIEPEPQNIVERIFGDPVIAGILSALGLVVAGLGVSFVRVTQKNKKNGTE